MQESYPTNSETVLDRKQQVFTWAQLSYGKLRKKPATRLFDKSFAPLRTSLDRFARQKPLCPPFLFEKTSANARKAHNLSGPRQMALTQTNSVQY